MSKSSNRSQAWDRSLDRSHVDCGPRYGTHQGTHVGVYDCHPYVHRPVLERVGHKELQCRLLSSARRNQDRGLRVCGDRSQVPSVVLLTQLKAEVVTCCKLRRFPDRHLFGHLQLPLRVFIDARTTNSTSGMANVSIHAQVTPVTGPLLS